MAEPDTMSPLAFMRDPFSEVDDQSEGVLAIRELPCVTQLTLRVDPDGGAAAAVVEGLGQPLPTLPNTLVSQGGLDVLWMGPDEWLLVDSAQSPAELEARIRARLAAQGASDPVSLVDVSAQRTVVELAGPAVRGVLARGCALDLHESAFRPGQCAQTLLAHSPVILHAVAETDAVRVYVRASFARHLGAWLLDASLEERTGVARGVSGEPALPSR